MLNKNILPGTVITVRSLKGITAGVVGGPKTLSSLVLRSSSDLKPIGFANLGESLTVIKKPRKVNGINLCRVKNSHGIEGEVYWTELRGNCEI